MVKKITVMMTMFVILILGGCRAMNSEPRTDINEQALAHMTQRYGVTFEYAQAFGDSFSNTHEFFATTDSLPGQKILVQIENYRHEDRIFRSNYLAVKFLEETIDFLRECAMKVFTDAIVHFNVINDGLSPDLVPNASFCEYLADTRVPLGIFIEVKESNFSSDEQLMEVAERIASRVGRFHLTVVVVDDNSYGESDRDALFRQVALRQFVYAARIDNLDSRIQIERLAREE